MKKLSAPTVVTFLISLVLTIIGTLAALGFVTGLPIAAIWVVVAGYALLAVGVVFRGI